MGRAADCAVPELWRWSTSNWLSSSWLVRGHLGLIVASLYHLSHSKRMREVNMMMH